MRALHWAAGMQRPGPALAKQATAGTAPHGNLCMPSSLQLGTIAVCVHHMPMLALTPPCNPCKSSVSQVHERYTALARAVLNFEKATFASWRADADAVAMARLKQPILTKDATGTARAANRAAGSLHCAH